MVKIDPALVEEEVLKQDQEVYGEDEERDPEEDTAERLEDMTGDDEEGAHELNIAKEVEDDEKDLAGIPDDVNDEDPEHIDDEVDIDPFGGIVKTDGDEAESEEDDSFEE